MNGNVPITYRRHGDNNQSENSFKTANGEASKSFQLENEEITVDKMKVLMLQERMSEMRQSLMNDMNDRLNDMMSEMMKRIRLEKPKENGFQKNIVDRSEKKRNGQLIEKQFVERNSYLTELLNVNHIRTIYNIFIVMLIILFLNTAVHDYLETGSLQLGGRTLKLAFGNILDFIKIWSFMLFSTFGTYLGFSIWANKRMEFSPRSTSLKVLDYVFISLHTCHQIAFIIYPTKILLEEKLPPGTSMAVMMEQVRMIMKTHAFVRSTAPRILAQKRKEDDKISNCPGFSKFLYFMFAPTLIYRDEYPRNKEIRWKIAMWNLSEVVMVVIYTAFIFERFIIPPFEKSGSGILEPKTVILTIFSVMLPGLIMYLFGFYLILHSWQNFMAELLRFGDRLFYTDWWNCTSYDAFYRTWNILVHDWLYAYIYRDLYEKSQNRLLATLTTFLVSALFHEYILAFSFRFFYPVMFVLFAGFGLILVFLMRNYSKMDGNIFIWLSLFIGNGIIFTLYSMEYYARANCSPHKDQLLDILLPRSWFCHSMISNATTVSS